ncbi:MAG: hypothetical protein J5J00_09175 [Deltaproteobacteria bacterium]|nr:hypothetical protein [Deltaproteobacteria bacterium]
MRKQLLITIIALFALNTALYPEASLSDNALPSKRVVLITLEEAGKPDARPIKGMSERVEPSEGPVIEFVAPRPESEVEKPVAISISFKENQAPIDISSLEVSYLKLFSIDITDRVKPYVTDIGIDIKEAELPSGSHKVKFSIRDIQNNLTERTLKIKII